MCGFETLAEEFACSAARSPAVDEGISCSHYIENTTLIIQPPQHIACVILLTIFVLPYVHKILLLSVMFFQLFSLLYIAILSLDFNDVTQKDTY